MMINIQWVELPLAIFGALCILGLIGTTFDR
jgi:hypothetical protein